MQSTRAMAKFEKDAIAALRSYFLVQIVGAKSVTATSLSSQKRVAICLDF